MLTALVLAAAVGALALMRWGWVRRAGRQRDVEPPPPVPPLRSERDVMALREALADGTIDIVATDHAPHPVEDKDCEWADAAMGMVGLETAVGVVAQALVETGLLDWAGVAERMSAAPARIGRLAGHGRPLEAGEPANLVLVDPSRETTVAPSELHSRSRNTPYAGLTLPASVVATFLRGRPTLLDGTVRSASHEGVSA